jgi:hypothetical protein
MPRVQHDNDYRPSAKVLRKFEARANEISARIAKRTRRARLVGFFIAVLFVLLFVVIYYSSTRGPNIYLAYFAGILITVLMLLSLFLLFMMMRSRIDGQDRIILSTWLTLNQVINAMATGTQEGLADARSSLHRLGTSLPYEWSFGRWYFHGELERAVDALGRILKKQGDSLERTADYRNTQRLLTQIMEIFGSDDPRAILEFLMTTTRGQREPQKTFKQRMTALFENVTTHRSVTLVLGALVIELFVGAIVAVSGGQLSPTLFAALAALFFTAIVGLNVVLPRGPGA